MSGKVLVRRIEGGIFRDRARLEALSDCEKVYDSVMGPRCFFLDEGDRVTVGVSKGLMLREGEAVNFDEIVTSGNAYSFPWCWG